MIKYKYRQSKEMLVGHLYFEYATVTSDSALMAEPT